MVNPQGPIRGDGYKKRDFFRTNQENSSLVNLLVNFKVGGNIYIAGLVLWFVTSLCFILVI